MKTESVFDAGFKQYGTILENYDFTEFLRRLSETPCPQEGIVYAPSDAKLESLPVAKELENRFYGGMPIQIGYCNGHNGTLNCLEYHRDSEVDVFATDAVLLVALQSELERGTIHTERVRAFHVPAGTAVQLFATTLHYAPCTEDSKSRFRVAIILPRKTNTDIPEIETRSGEERLLWARNKWLIAHPDSAEAREGAAIGLLGENLHLW